MTDDPLIGWLALAGKHSITHSHNNFTTPVGKTEKNGLRTPRWILFREFVIPWLSLIRLHFFFVCFPIFFFFFWKIDNFNLRLSSSWGSGLIESYIIKELSKKSVIGKKGGKRYTPKGLNVFRPRFPDYSFNRILPRVCFLMMKIISLPITRPPVSHHYQPSRRVQDRSAPFRRRQTRRKA